MNYFIQSGLAGVTLYAALIKVLLTLAIIMGLWALASVLLALLIGGTFQLFGHSQECCKEILEASRVKPRLPLASSSRCGTETRRRIARIRLLVPLDMR
jgi:hypothetical protein